MARRKFVPMTVKQTIPKELRFTIQDFNRRFPDDSACLDEVMKMRYPDGITYCAKCEQERKHYRIAGRPVYGCGHCGTQISPMAGTIFQHSSTSLQTWFYAMYLMAQARVAVSPRNRFNARRALLTKPRGACSNRFARCSPIPRCDWRDLASRWMKPELAELRAV